jgi:uncharacterized RDD family membrane protein YckC
VSGREPLGAPGPTWGEPAATPPIAVAPAAAAPAVAAPPEPRYASFGRRAAAMLIDAILLAVLLGILSGALYAAYGVDPEAVDAGSVEAEEDFAAFVLTTTVAPIAYFWVLNAVGWSPGKQALRLRIVRADGQPPGFGVGFARTVCSLLSVLPLGLGLLWVLFDRNRQTWHDKLAGTYVVYDEQQR